MKRSGLQTLRRNLILPAAIGSLFAPCGTWAQVPQPDAGRILNELERSAPPGLPLNRPGQPVIEDSARPAMSAPSGASFRVTAFRISRTTAYTEAELLPLLKDFIGRDLTLADVNRAADILTRHYREHGHFVARAYVPAQDIRDGIVEIVVLEGFADKINVAPRGAVRLSESFVRDTLAAALGTDGIIRQENLERGLLLLDDIPGVDVHAALAPGASVGASSITAQVSEGALVTGSLNIDNSGNKFTGTERLGAALNLNDPSGRGDDASLRYIHSSGVDYGRIGYQIPVGRSGFKVGAAYTQSRYSLCCDFAPLDAKGTAKVATVNLSYPFIRTLNYSLRGGLSYDARSFVDEALSTTTSDRTARVLTGSLAADGRDGFGGGGMANGLIALSQGNLDLSDQGNDPVTARTAHPDGSYSKVFWALARLQRLGEKSALYGALAGQFASKNLDSSEKFALGGPQGVRAYPQGEATGDEGILLNLEYRYELTPGLRLSAFLDHGSIRLARNEWAPPSTIPNSYSLSGAGLGLQWSQPGDFIVQFSFAHRLGSNPGRDVNGNDADAASHKSRIWLQAIKFF